MIRRRYLGDCPIGLFNTHLEHRITIPLGPEQDRWWSMLTLFDMRKYVNGTRGVVEDEVEG